MPGRNISGIELAFADRIERGASLQIFEAVARNDHAQRRLVKPVVGPADPLQQAGAALGRAHLDDEVDIAPVDAEVEAGGGDQRTDLAVGHGCFDFAARLDRQAAVMDADRQRLVVDRPKLLKYQLGQATGVAEHQRGPVLFDHLHHFTDRVESAMA